MSASERKRKDIAGFFGVLFKGCPEAHLYFPFGPGSKLWVSPVHSAVDRSDKCRLSMVRA